MGWPEKLVLIRHAESEGNIKTVDERAGFYLATHNYSLTDKGKKQAEATGKYLRDQFGRFDTYYTSYYRRAKETMKIMCPGVKVYEDSRLAEAQRGIYHSLTKAQIEEKYPDDHRPRNAIETLQAWIKSGVFRMAVIRKASLDSHAAAREVGEDNAARSAARAAGQAVATAHVPRHSYGPAVYAQQAIYRATNPSETDAAVAKERAWQYQHLLDLRNSHPSIVTTQP